MDTNIIALIIGLVIVVPAVALNQSDDNGVPHVSPYSPHDENPNGPKEDCIFKVEEGSGLDGSGSVTSVASGLGGCCSEALYGLQFHGDAFQVEVIDIATGQRTRESVGGSDFWIWQPPSDCGGPWLIQAYHFVAPLGDWYPVAGAHATVYCEEVCE